MKKIILSLFFLATSFSLCAQGWDLVAWGVYSAINAKFGEEVEEFVSPYMDCLIGQQVTLMQPDYLYHKYNWKHEEGKKEIDFDDEEWFEYIGKRYMVTRVGYGADAGFFQYGVVFELERNGEKIYAILKNRRIIENDGLSTIFKEALPCPTWYRIFLKLEENHFTNTSYVYSQLARLTDDQKGFIAIGKALGGDNTQYEMIVHMGSNTEMMYTDKLCVIILKNGTRLTLPAETIEVTHLDEPYKLYYSSKFSLTKEQVDLLASSYITDVRLDNIYATDIRQSVGQRIMYIVQSVLAY